MECQRLLAGIKISKLNSEISRHKAAIKKRAEMTEELQRRVDEIRNNLNLTQIALLENNQKVDALSLLNATIWSDTKRRVEAALKEAGPIQRLANPLWRFTKSFEYEMKAGENSPLEDKRFALNDYLLEVNINLTIALNITESLKRAIRDSQESISNLKNAHSQLATENSDEASQLASLRSKVGECQGTEISGLKLVKLPG